MMANVKIERLNHAMQEEISKILMTEVKDENIKFVTITGCDISSDLSYCKVYFTTLDEAKKDETLTTLNKAASFIRGEVSQRIEMRHTPELKFLYDDSIAYGQHMEQVINQINRKEYEL